MKKRLMILALVVLLGCAAVAWQLWPRSLADALDVDGDLRVTLCWLTAAGVSEGGEPYIHVYDVPLDVLTQVEERLNDDVFHPDWRMLLPWEANSAEQDLGATSAMLMVAAEGKEYTLLVSADRMLLSTDGDGSRWLHFDSGDLLDALTSLAQDFGKLQ